MTEFALLALLLLLPGVLLLVPGLLRPRERLAEDLNARNLRIARERLAELEAERDNGGLTPEAFDQAKAELEGTLLDDLRQEDTGHLNTASAPVTLVLLVFLVPLTVGLLYLNLGAPGILERLASQSQNVPASSAQPAPSMDKLLVQLEEKLKANPDNLEGWSILARSYLSLQRYDDAVRALEACYRLAPEEPNILVTLADALAMQNQGKITPRGIQLLEKALQLNPNNPTAYWLLGMAKQEQGKPQEAVELLRRALPLLQSDPEAVARIQQQIDAIQEQSPMAEGQKSEGEPTEEKGATEAKISVRVELGPKLQAQVSADDTLFILTRSSHKDAQFSPYL